MEVSDGSFKVELVHHDRYATRDEAKASTVEVIEVFFNRIRRQSTLEDMTPDEFERTHGPDGRSLAAHFPWGRSHAAHSSSRFLWRLHTNFR
jgi:hypothetical protein